ncbi:MAG TPA: hypothetical protein PK636_08540 [bacterium]|nr:hypothetical protein [bacterium]HPJ72718.1 hypothetical protein [bacterium]HPQ65684.1 hypothetical protein [bacterium]
MALKQREKRTVLVGGGGFLLIAVVWFLFLREGSLWDQWVGVNERIEEQEISLQKMERLHRKYAVLRSKTDQILRGMGGVGGETVLNQGLIEKLAAEKAPAAELTKMNTRNRTVHDLYKVVELQVELAGVPLDQLVDFLYAVEYQNGGSQVIRELTVALNRKNDDLLDVEATIISAEPLKNQGAERK